jgi:hypothetical protein
MGEAKLLTLKLNMPARVTRSGLRIVCWLPAPMKRMRRVAVRTALLAQIILLATGCNKSTDRHDIDWTPPVAVAASIDGLGGWIVLHKSGNTLIGVCPFRDGSAQLLVLSHAKNSWSKLPVSGISGSYPWAYAAFDPQSQRILLADGFAEREQFTMKALMGTVVENSGIQNLIEKNWITDKKTLLGETGSNVSLTDPPASPELVNTNWASLGIGILNGSDMQIPYSFNAKTYTETPVAYQGKTHFRRAFERGPYNNGVFHWTDSGETWRMERISSFDSLAPEMCQTKAHYYYFGTRYPIIGNGVWVSKKSVTGSAWTEPTMMTTTFANVYGRFDVVADGDTAHICWMDRRHNKMRFNLTGPPIENNDIYYRRRKDSDADWGKEVHLSKGMLYCYAPTISTEGNNVVVVWAGIQSADKQHTYLGPNDIYYVTSKYAGKTWTAPLRVTDGAKDGITAGMPQVALLKGVIHLLYTQGAQNQPTELSPGLTKLGEGSWPIYYQQRPFPN